MDKIIEDYNIKYKSEVYVKPLWKVIIDEFNIQTGIPSVEDKDLISLFDTATKIVESDTLTVDVFKKLKDHFENTTPKIFFFHGFIWDDIISNDEYADIFDPISKYQFVLHGELGHIDEVLFMTDIFRHEELQVIPYNTGYMLDSKFLSKGFLDVNSIVKYIRKSDDERKYNKDL